MSNDIKRKANIFIKQHKLRTLDYSEIEKAAMQMGYTIIEFNSIANDADVDTIIRNLELSEKILKSRGFTYVSKDYRLIFVNEDLSTEEKILVLSHEIGHIVCGHFAAGTIIGNDVKEEYEANEFSHYLLQKSAMRKTRDFIAVHRKTMIASVIMLCLIAGVLIVSLISEQSKIYMDNLYITSTGNHYHKQECIFVKNKTNVQKLTKDDFEGGLYIPCDMCLPDEE